MKRFKPRHGYSLIELLVFMSVAVVIMMVNIGWIHHTMKFSSLMKQRQLNHHNLSRLAWELRDDVHLSNAMSIDGDNRLVLEQNDGTTATYLISGTSLEFEKRHGDGTIQRESYALSPNSNVFWDVSEFPNWISLVVARGPEGLARPHPGESGSDSEATELTAVDLHVRVSPNRWAVTSANKESAKENNEESK